MQHKLLIGGLCGRLTLLSALTNYYANVAQDKHQQAAYCLRAAEYVIGVAVSALTEEEKKDVDHPAMTGKANVCKEIAKFFGSVLAQARGEKELLGQLMQADPGSQSYFYVTVAMCHFI